MMPSMIQTLGEFSAEIPPSDEYLTLNFSPSSVPRKRRWGNYGLSADFLGDYFAAFFPGDDLPDSKINRRDTVKAAVSYIANELLENAVKYSEGATDLPISITLYLYEREIIFQVTNHTPQERADRYQQFIHELLNSDIDALYTRHLEKSALENGESNMGLLTVINDYSAQCGWKFCALESSPDLVQVTVLARLEV